MGTCQRYGSLTVQIQSLALQDVLYCSCPPDGKRHIKVDLGTASGPERSAMEAALNEWNSFKDTTGVVFDIVPSGTPADLEFSFTLSRTLSGGCASFNPSSSRIYYSTQLGERMNNLGQAEVVAVFVHELGHFLGLAHTTNPPTMMNQPPPGSTCATGTNAVRNIQQADAVQVTACMTQCIEGREIGDGEVADGGNGSGGVTCRDTYEPVDYTECNAEGCHTTTVWQYAGQECW